jgi:serine/threonine protein kinase
MVLLDEALWRRLSPLLDRALELSAEERSALVATLRDAEPELAAALEGALAAHERAAASGFLAPAAGSPARSLAGQVLGSYRLVERIGSGGMGSVWRGTRVDGRFEGEVAVKLLHPSLIEGEGAERFRREGTILSRLTHPGIARLYDAGVSEAGQPYLVLELVDGEPIDRYADARRLDVDARLALFLQVGEAVANAHSSLVVHRDLKPSNILVDRDGRVKLLDFGIATLLDAASGEASLRTQTAARALTPQYAAPEQLEGGAITTATDVYALGVLLYELLTGEHPTTRAQASTAELVRAITTADPPRMSERIRRAENRGGEADRFTLRAATRERLARALAGDLDTIADKALKRDPAARYLTVAAFAEDLQRHLNHLPVKARRDSFGYRARKLVARHRLEVAATAVVIASLVASTAIALRQARLSERQRDRALEELYRAEITNDLSAFLLSEASPGAEPIRKSELLRRGEEMIEGRFAGAPDLQAHMLLVLSERYYETSEFASWRRILERAYERSRETSDPRLRAVAGCELAVSLADRDMDRSRRLLDESLRELQGATEPAAELARCRLAEAIVARRLGELDRAVAAAEASLALERARSGPPGRGANALNALALIQTELGKYDAASRTYEQLFELFRSQRRERTRTAATLHHNWAVALQSAGQIRRAIRESERGVALARELDPETGASPNQLWVFGSALSVVGRHAEAVAAMDEAVARARRSEGTSISFWALVYAGRVYAEAGMPDAADQRFAELDRLIAASPALPAWFAGWRDGYGAAAQVERGNPARAVELAERALATFEAAKRPREILPTRLLLARAYNDLGRHEEARAQAAPALAAARERLGDFAHSRGVGLAELELARAAFGSGDPLRARAANERALDHLRASMGDGAPETRRALALRDSLAAAD